MDKYIEYLNILYLIGENLTEEEVRMDGELKTCIFDKIYDQMHMVIDKTHVNNNIDALDTHIIVNSKMFRIANLLGAKQVTVDLTHTVNVLCNIEKIGRQFGDMPAYVVLCLFTRLYLIQTNPLLVHKHESTYLYPFYSIASFIRDWIKK